MAEYAERRDGWRDHPLASRLPRDPEVVAEIIGRHDAALESGLPCYMDPISGFSVFTSDFLAKRGYCCESGCRHCPFVVDG